MTLTTLVSLSDLLNRWRVTDTVVIECRNCGASLDEDAEGCPHCGSQKIVRYNDLE